MQNNIIDWKLLIINRYFRIFDYEKKFEDKFK